MANRLQAYKIKDTDDSNQAIKEAIKKYLNSWFYEMEDGTEFNKYVLMNRVLNNFENVCSGVVQQAVQEFLKMIRRDVFYTENGRCVVDKNGNVAAEIAEMKSEKNRGMVLELIQCAIEELEEQRKPVTIANIMECVKGVDYRNFRYKTTINLICSSGIIPELQIEPNNEKDICK